MNEKEVYEYNEIKANRILAYVSLVEAFVLFVLLMVTIFSRNSNILGFTLSTKKYIYWTVPMDIIFLCTPILFINSSYIKKSGFKYFLIILYILVVSLVNVILPKDGVLLWASVIALASLYFNPKFTFFSFIVVLCMMAFCTPLGLIFGSWESNMLAINQTQFATVHKLGTDLKSADGLLNPESTSDRLYWVNNFKKLIEYNNLGITESNRWVAAFAFYFLPRALIITVIAVLGNILSSRTDFILREQISETKHVQKMTSELSIATQIQAATLPSEFPDSKFGELYAIMDPAKEVGGDLYDFFEIDDSHIALVIGDASGKGVPASLFMMKAQSLVRALTKSNNIHTDQIMTEVNNALCEGNDLTMFVTCWLGILDKETGILNYTNAGHNPPIIRTKDEIKYLNAKPGLVLGGFKNFQYKESTITLFKGDKLFLYTDGVTEAHDVKSQLYGEERLIKLVDSINSSPFETISKVRDDIREFSRNTEQFDDITMLMIEYRKPQQVFTKKFRAIKENLETVQNFIIDSIKTELTPKDKNELMIVIEEIFINVASYSYVKTGDVEIDVNLDNNVLTVVFKDKGVKFNPLAKEDPNTSLQAQDRGIGGLGIFMVKNLMDKVYYEYKDNKNILTMVKKYK